MTDTLQSFENTGCFNKTVPVNNQCHYWSLKACKASFSVSFTA
ncbi:MAG: hypothetical protein OFPI_26310 [Osedax symbiont Rs2]|nr:MAG: hypothetical protein OFPI_26310 [Osedax symbiont Rs2]